MPKASEATRTCVLFACVVAACSQPPTALRAIDLAADPEPHVGKDVSLTIVEDLLTSEARGDLRVDLPEYPDRTLALAVPVGRPLPESPALVVGRVRRAANQSGWVVDVTSSRPLARGPYESAPSIDAILAEPSRWDRRWVTYEGTWTSGFESSELDERIWLDLHASAREAASSLPPSPRAPGAPPRRTRVRVQGILYARPQSGYGHLGHSPLAIVADRLVVLDGAVTP